MIKKEEEKIKWTKQRTREEKKGKEKKRRMQTWAPSTIKNGPNQNSLILQSHDIEVEKTWCDGKHRTVMKIMTNGGLEWQNTEC